MDDKELCYVICPESGQAVCAWFPFPHCEGLPVSSLSRLQDESNYALDVSHNKDAMVIEIPGSEELPLALRHLLAENLARTLSSSLDVHPSFMCIQRKQPRGEGVYRNQCEAVPGTASCFCFIALTKTAYRVWGQEPHIQ